MKKLLLFTLLLIQTYWLTAQDLPDDLQIGRHTVAEWKYIVDTTWGDGMPTEDKLLLFDRFWEAVDLHYPGFVNNPVNWDSVKNHYRPEIEAGVSKGRFAGIINKMGLLLQEGHSGAYNLSVYLTKPERDIPVLIPSYYSDSDSNLPLQNGWFGAALTPLSDDELLVLRCVADHPMGLEAGDIVLGYDGMPWKDLYPLLLQMDLPYSTNFRIVEQNGSYQADLMGSSEKSTRHKWLASAGMNWHFFDTLDFRKYGSSDTLHAPTALLEGKKLYVAGNEQLPVEGIEFPMSDLTSVIFDTIMDNSIGYVYFLNMVHGDFAERLKTAFQVFKESDVQGIIIDLRYNLGGYIGWQNGFDPIFNRNIDSCSTYVRTQNGDHSDLETSGNFLIPLSEEFLNRPIALLTGPGAMSQGDYVSYFIHTQSMTRSFGRATNTAYTLYDSGLTPNTPSNFNNLSFYWNFGYEDWVVHFAPRNFGRYIDGKLTYFLHNGFELDEEIWLTQEAAYQQKDNMVERALEWITSVPYANGFSIQNQNIDPGLEAQPFIISIDVENPESHPVELYVKVYDREGTFIEEINKLEDIDGSIPGTGEEKWFGTFSPEPNSYYFTEISTHDLDEDTWLSYPGRLSFTTVPIPEIFPKTIHFQAGSTSRSNLTLTNTSEISLNIPFLKFSCADPRLEIKSVQLSFGQILEKDQSAQKLLVVGIDDTVEDSSEIWIQVDIYESGKHYWSDSILLIASTVGEEDILLTPELNIYPNPMREFCNIQIIGPSPLERIELFDLSGRLVFSENNINSGSFNLPKGKLANGIYILKVYADNIYESKLVVQ